MPSIEIVSLFADKLDLKQSDFEIAFIQDEKLIGHRGLFNEFLKNQEGVMIHIGNPDLKNDKNGGFFAGNIINWDFEPSEIMIPNYENGETGSNQQFCFKFLHDYKIDIGLILEVSIEKSAINEAYFMTDYQFGPENIQFITMSLKDFWNLHDESGLNWNTLYKLRK